jgi:hypothetical protein
MRRPDQYIGDRLPDVRRQNQEADSLLNGGETVAPGDHCAGRDSGPWTGIRPLSYSCRDDIFALSDGKRPHVAPARAPWMLGLPGGHGTASHSWSCRRRGREAPGTVRRRRLGFAIYGPGIYSQDSSPGRDRRIGQTVRCAAAVHPVDPRKS